ncbi:MAG: C1 family peptidase [Bacteroidota bacterium]
MPIRMEKDEQQPSRERNNPQPNRPGGSGLTKLLPFLLLFLFKKPKLILPVLIIGAILYFMSGGSFFQQYLAPLTGGEEDDPTEFSMGFDPNQEEYDKRLVYASLADNKNSMPSKVSLAQYAPPRLNQGRQGSCVGWASAYAARTILHSKQTGSSPRNASFSPSYVYNQIAFEGCQGTYLHYAMETMMKKGALPFAEFEYNEGSCRLQPSQSEVREAAQYRIKGYERLSLGANNYKVDVNAIRQYLAAGSPVVIGMMVGQSFTYGMKGSQLWQPTRQDLNGTSRLGGHAMCVIGYDDTVLNGEGAFQIMNSWGRDWGDDGIAWVGYDDFEYFVKEAYGLYPMGDAKSVDQNKLAAQFGLLVNNAQTTVPLQQVSGNIFRTQRPMQKGEKFKIAIANSIECYTYIFGEETDGSSYVLFPYTEKHSAYCGITGTRIFPNDYSMVPDEIGNTDWMAMVVSKKPIDFQQLNRSINNSRKSTFAGKVSDALSSQLVNNPKFTTPNGNVQFEGDVQNKNAVAVVIAVDKQ